MKVQVSPRIRHCAKGLVTGRLQDSRQVTVRARLHGSTSLQVPPCVTPNQIQVKAPGSPHKLP